MTVLFFVSVLGCG